MSNGWYATYNDFGATWGKAIGAVGIAIYQSLASRAWDGQCFPSYQTIADDTGVSRPTAIKYIKKLQKAGLVEVQPRFNRRGDPTSHLYTLANLPMLKKKIEAEAKPSFEELDISGLSEDEIAELKRKSLFLPRSKKKSRKPSPAPTAAPEATSETLTPEPPPVSPALPVAQIEKVEVVKLEPPSPPPASVAVAAPQQEIQDVPAPQVATQTKVISVPNLAPKPEVKERISLGEFGEISPQSDIINAYHMLKPVSNKQEVIDELNKAIREGRIQTTPLQYLGGLIKKVQQGEFVPSANKKTEDEIFREQQERAMEKEKERKKAIAECSRCSEVGHLVYSAVEPYGPKVRVCTHDERADKFIADKKAEEARGETVCYFGKGKPLSNEEAIQALGAIRETVATMTGKTPKTIALEPTEIEQDFAPAPVVEPQPEPVIQQVPPVPVETSPLPETEATEVVEGKEDDGPYDGFKTMAELSNFLIAKMSQPKRKMEELPDELPPAENTQSPVKILNIETKVAVDDNPLSQEVSVAPKHVIAEPFSQETLDGFTESFEQPSEAQREKLFAQAPQPTGTRRHPNGKLMSPMAEKIAILKERLDNIYNYEELIVQKELRSYLRMQTVVRAARLRAMVHNSENFSDGFKERALFYTDAIQRAAPIMLTVPYLRKNRLIIDKLIEIYQAPQDRPLAEPSQEILIQRLLDSLQEFNFVKRCLSIEFDYKRRSLEDSRTPREVREHHEEMRQIKQLQLICLIQDEYPELKGRIAEANERMPKEWKFTPAELNWALSRYDNVKLLPSS